MTNTMKRLAVLLIGTLFVLCVAIVLAVSLPVSIAFAAEGEPEATVHDHTDVTWTELTADGGTLQSGNYYLAGDVTLTTDITIADNATVTLCLNGYKLTGAGTSAVITVGAGASFTLEDCSADASAPAGTGVITGGIGFLDLYTVRRGGGVYISGNSTFTMNGGTISGNTATTGGGVGVDNDGTFTMNGGTISGNSATNGGVYVRYGTFTMSGGTISGNTASGSGGGVYIYDSTFTMLGGTISGNTATSYGGGGGVYIYDSTFTMLGGTISGNSATNGGGVDVDGTFTMNGGTISGNSATNGGGVYIDGTFTMNGGTISDNTASGNGGGVHVGRDGSFTMNNGTISVNSATNGGGVYIDGTFTMNGGTLTDNFASEYGGGVYINNIATFTLEDGTISGNIARYIGGVHVVGIFNMNGGTISGNFAFNGGGVYVDGMFTLTGGTISGNMAAYGGGVYVDNTFTMTGGTISGNMAAYGGGGVYMNGGKFTMNGGYLGEDIIKNNGTVSISGGYFAEEFDTAYLAENCAAHDISAFGTALDPDYIAGFPYAVYANGTEITASANAGIIYDGSPVAAGTDFTVTGTDGLVLAYAYKTDGNYASGLPAGAGTYTVKAAALSVDGSYSDTEFPLTIAKAAPAYTAPTDLTVVAEGTLADIALPDGWAWKDGTVRLTETGEYKAVAIYTPADTANYNPVEAELTVTVLKPAGLSGGAIAGIVIGCMLGVLLIEYGVFALLYKKKLISGAFFAKIYPFIKD